MITVEIKGLDKLEKKFNNIAVNFESSIKSGIEMGLDNTKSLAVRLAKGRIKDCIKAEIINTETNNVIAGRVFNDVNMLEWSSYVEFGTGKFVDDNGIKDAIRLKRSTQIPWYIHVSMVPESFAKYNYPLITSWNGEQYWQVVGSHPHPYMKPSGFQSRKDNVKQVINAINNMIEEAVR